jgi:hypothetical protein
MNVEHDGMASDIRLHSPHSQLIHLCGLTVCMSR